MLLITVFDGLRPDFVRPDLTPALWQLRQEGVWFAESHCVFPSSTRVNAPALATGSVPTLHGIPGNSFYVPNVEPTALLNSGRHADLRLLRQAGPLLRVPALAEVLAANGKRTVVAGTGSSGCTYLLHPEIGRTDQLFHAEFCEPPELREAVQAWLGPPQFDDPKLSDGERTLRLIEYGARALSDVLVPDARPDVAYFWCTVPDHFQHRFGLGAPGSLTALQEADRVFGELLSRLQTRESDFDVIVTSDHGYASVAGHVDLRGALQKARLATRPWFEDTVVAADGNAALIYLPGDTGKRRRAVADYLLSQDWVAAVFTHEGSVPGTLSLADVLNQSGRSPDIVCALAWDRGSNDFGAEGRSLGSGYIAVGAGDHGGISPYEMHNTLLAAGPSFKGGFVDETACGITDIAPTALACLDLKAPALWSGRVLTEALRNGAPAPDTDRPSVDVKSRLANGRLVVQELKQARVGGTVYICEANKRLI